MLPRLIFPDKKCTHCGARFNRSQYASGREEAPKEFLARRFCSKDCYWTFHRGKNHVNYIPGGTITVWGYVRTVDPDGSGRRGHLHRIKMEKKLGRRLERNEHVHHKDGDPLNNKMSNLEVVGSSEHASMHSPLRKRNKKGQYA